MLYKLTASYYLPLGLSDSLLSRYCLEIRIGYNGGQKYLIIISGADFIIRDPIKQLHGTLSTLANR